MTGYPATDRYAGAAHGWATGARRVYQPLAAELVSRTPHSLRGRLVLDVGAGTGVGSTELVKAGAARLRWIARRTCWLGNGPADR